MCVLDQVGRAMMEIRVVEAQCRGKYPTVWRQAESKQPGWLSRQGCQLVSQLGHRLVALGERLERFGMPQPSLTGKNERVQMMQMKEAS